MLKVSRFISVFRFWFRHFNKLFKRRRFRNNKKIGEIYIVLTKKLAYPYECSYEIEYYDKPINEFQKN